MSHALAGHTLETSQRRADERRRPDRSAGRMGRPLEVLTFGRSGVDIYPLQVGVGPGGRRDLRQVPRRHDGQRRRRRGPARAQRRPSSPASATTRSAATSAGRCASSASTTATWSPTTSTPRRSPSARSSRRTTSRSGSTASRPRRTSRSSRPTSTSTPSATTRLMWLSVTGLSEEPSRESHFAVLEARAAQAVHRARPGLPADVLGDPGRRPPSRSSGAATCHRRRRQPRGVRGRGR